MSDSPRGVRKKRKRSKKHLNHSPSPKRHKSVHHNHQTYIDRDDQSTVSTCSIINNYTVTNIKPEPSPSITDSFNPSETNQLQKDLQELNDSFALFPSNDVNNASNYIKQEHTHNSNISLKQRYAKAIDKIKQLTSTNLDYLLRLKGLRHKLINGEDPRFSLVKMYKKDLKFTKTTKKYQSMLIKSKSELVDPQIMIHSDFNHPKIREQIVAYLHENGLDNSQPNIYFGDDDYCPYHEVLTVFNIGEQHRIKALIGSKGLMTNCNIPKHTVLGQYVGITYTKEEYKKIFEHSNQWTLRNQFAFDESVNIPIIRDKEVKREKVELVLDGFGLGFLNETESDHMSKINDCRLDIINCTNPTIEDEEYHNVDFVSCAVNGWPVIFVVAVKDIQKDTELFGFYGGNFGEAVEDQQSVEAFRRSLEMLLDTKILKPIAHQMQSSDDLTVD